MLPVNGKVNGFVVDRNADEEASSFDPSKYFPSFCGQRPLFPEAPTEARIVGGATAAEGQFPWQVQLWVVKNGKDKFQCGGTLVAEELVVTAAHCFKHLDLESYTVVLGRLSNDDSKECSQQKLKLRKVIVHPDFNSRELTYDIALAFVETKYKQSATFTDQVQPACMPAKSDSGLYSTGLSGTASGWGLTDESDRFSASPTLQFVSVPMLHHERCSSAYSKLVQIREEIQFCAGNDRGQDACAGDSGGPYVRLVGDRWVLVGVVSFGKGCARPEFPGVYVRVQNFLTWIYGHIETDLKESGKLYMYSGDGGGGGGGGTPDDTRTTTRSPTTTAATTTTTTRSTTTRSTTTTTRTTTKTTTTTTKSTVPDGGSGGGGGGNIISIPDAAEKEEKSVGPVCRSSFKYVNCPSGQTITVTKAFYGRRTGDSHICQQRGFSSSNRAFSSCSLQFPEFYLNRHCQGRVACWVYHGLFAQDPCPHISNKYITFSYVCTDGGKMR